MLALLINASILILAPPPSIRSEGPTSPNLPKPSRCCRRSSARHWRRRCLASRCLCCGLNSTVTATLAGQAVMEGFLDIRLPAWMRRLLTRSVAIIPAAGVTLFYGERETCKLLILTQVDPQPAAAVRDCAAGSVHGEPQENGRSRRAPVADSCCNRDRGHDHRPERQIDLRFYHGIRA